MNTPASQRFSFTGVIIYAAIAGALYLGLIYLVFRIFHPSHAGSTAVVLWGQNERASSNYGFGPDWSCQYQKGRIKQAGRFASATPSPHPRIIHRSLRGSIRAC